MNKVKKQSSFLPKGYVVKKIKQPTRIITDDQLAEIEKAYPPPSEQVLNQFNKQI